MKNLRKHILSFILVAMFIVNVVNTNSAIKADYELNDEIGSITMSILSPSFQMGFNPEIDDPSLLTYPLEYELYFKYDTGEYKYIDSMSLENEASMNKISKFKMVNNTDEAIKSAHITMKNKQSGIKRYIWSQDSNMYFTGLFTEGGTFANGTDFHNLRTYYNQLVTYDSGYQEPIKPGFTFDGWEMDYPGSGIMWDVDNESITYHENLYAVWSAEPVIVDYAVSYDANGAVSGDVPSGTRVEENTAYTVLDTLPNLVNPGFTFDGWNTAQDGSGKAVQPDDSFTVTGDTIFYAQWKKEIVPAVEYTVSYDANGAVSGDVPSGTRVEENTVYTILDTLPNLVNSGFTFDGWNTAQDGSGKVVQPNDSFTVTGDTVFYAQWKKDIVPAVKYSVSYDANGATQGSVPSGSTVEENTVYEILGNLNNLAFDNHEFVGWNDKADGSGKHYDAKDTLTITSDKVLYAQWELEQKPIPTEPEVTEPEVTKPEVTKPEVTKPEVTKPEVTKPEVTKPGVTKPNIPGFEENATPQKSQVSGIESNVQPQLPNTGVSTSKFLPSLGLGIALAGAVLMVLRKKNEN
ncbi:InlB B-repeat-containing protein [Erysipelothrix rhusiopathiae]|uniref:InlB B-repeat-containing protein n=1 Tax=Erysipelothrix rhusiopathiae TaxID=1648 RepID=UPI002B24C95C|nr:InlB B-repeat-containing protein [Erysipelothrix rhusiopathiae]WRB93016.1 InlB B-repeat-containing protein [Erysipelothrix rhusiopathiae]